MKSHEKKFMKSLERWKFRALRFNNFYRIIGINIYGVRRSSSEIYLSIYPDLETSEEVRETIRISCTRHQERHESQCNQHFIIKLLTSSIRWSTRSIWTRTKMGIPSIKIWSLPPNLWRSTYLDQSITKFYNNRLMNPLERWGFLHQDLTASTETPASRSASTSMEPIYYHQHINFIYSQIYLFATHD